MFNFYLFYSLICRKEQRNSTEVEVIVSVSAGLNYIFVVGVYPLFKLRNIKNHCRPYMSIVEKIVVEVRTYLCSFLTIYDMLRPLLIVNTCYWLLVVYRIVITQHDHLFYQLASRSTLRAFLATTVLLHFCLHFLSRMDHHISTELLLREKK